MRVFSVCVCVRARMCVCVYARVRVNACLCVFKITVKRAVTTEKSTWHRCPECLADNSTCDIDITINSCPKLNMRERARERERASWQFSEQVQKRKN